MKRISALLYGVILYKKATGVSGFDWIYSIYVCLFYFISFIVQDTSYVSNQMADIIKN